MYYANYSNPFSDEETQRYIVVGIARLSEPVGKEMFFENVPDDIAGFRMARVAKKNYAGGRVWQLAWEACELSLCRRRKTMSVISSGSGQTIPRSCA